MTLPVIRIVEIAAFVAFFVARISYSRERLKFVVNQSSPGIADFKKRVDLRHQLTSKQRLAAHSLVDIIRSSQELNRQVITDLRKLKIPDPSLPKEIPELTTHIEESKRIFENTLQSVYSTKLRVKITGVIQEAAKNRFLESHGVATHASALGLLDTKIVEALDAAHIVDFAENGMHKVHDILMKMIGGQDHPGNVTTDTVHHVMSQATAHSVAAFTDFANNVLAIPGIVSSSKDAFREFRFFSDGESSWDEALVHAAVPIVFRTCAVGAGIALDAMFGWMTLGLFTLGFSLAYTYGRDQWLADEIGNLDKQIQVYIKEAKERRIIALQRINAAVARVLKSFSEKLRVTPNINDNSELKGFIGKLIDRSNEGLTEANRRVNRNLQLELSRIAPPTVLDKLLLIRTDRAVRLLYEKTARDICTRNSTDLHRLSLAAEAAPERAIRHLLDHHTFPTSEITALLDSTESLSKSVSEDFAAKLKQWEAECRESWRDGVKEVETITAVENAEVESTMTEMQKRIEPLKRKIRRHKIRRGMKAD